MSNTRIPVAIVCGVSCLAWLVPLKRLAPLGPLQSMSFAVEVHGRACVRMDGQFTYSVNGLSFEASGYERVGHKNLHHSGTLSREEYAALEQCVRSAWSLPVTRPGQLRGGFEPEYSYRLTASDSQGTRQLCFFRYPTPEYCDLIQRLETETAIKNDIQKLGLDDNESSMVRNAGGVVADSLTAAVAVGSHQMDGVWGH